MRYSNVNQKLTAPRNPWGRKEWYGAWGDGSKEWTPEWMEKLGHKFGNDGVGVHPLRFD